MEAATCIDGQQNEVPNDEYEEILVHLTFNEFSDSTVLMNSKSVTIGGLNTPHPYAVVDGIGFSGQYEINLGTKVCMGNHSADLMGISSRIVKFELKSIPEISGK